MDVPIGLAIAIVVALVVGVSLWRTRRPAGRNPLTPVRLGPSWSPTSDGEAAVAPVDPAAREARAGELARTTGLDQATVSTVLEVWDEYLAVLGLAVLPADHRYRVYDPYVPPVAERGPDGPVPDRDRVARDISGRTPVSQADALTVLREDATPADEDRGATSEP